jgi:membrane protease subunit (stomatin/prohibitin family)
MGPMGRRGFQRRGRRRGLIVGAAVGASMARRNQGQDEQSDGDDAQYAQSDMTTQLQELQELKNQGVITQEEFDAKKKQILGI